MTLNSIGSFLTRHKLLVLLLGILFCIAVFGLQTNKAYADSDCGVHSGNPAENFEGMIITVDVANSNGTDEFQSKDATISVTSESKATNTPDNFIANSNNSGNYDGYKNTDGTAQYGYSTVYFNQRDDGCASGSGWSLVLGYGDTSQNVDATSVAESGTIGAGNGEWYLRCGLDENNPQIFVVTGVGTPAGALPGGKWISTTLGNDGTDNGGTVDGNITYKEPPPQTGSINGEEIIDTDHSLLTETVNITANNSTENGNPFEFNDVPTGSQTVTDDTPIVPGYTLVASNWCNTSTCDDLDSSTNGPNHAGTDTTRNVTVLSNIETQMRWIYQKSPIGKPGSCPTTKQSLNPTITLPPGNKPAIPSGATQGSGGKSGTTTQPNAQYYQEVPGDWEITAANDYAEYGTSGTSLNNWTPSGYQSSNIFTLDYTNYIDKYPYDPHSTTVTYNQKFTQTHFHSSSTPDGHTCNPAPDYGGGSGSSPCYHPYTGGTVTHTSYTYTCNPAPDYGGGSSSTCYHPYTTKDYYAADRMYICTLPNSTGGGNSSSCVQKYSRDKKCNLYLYLFLQPWRHRRRLQQYLYKQIHWNSIL